MLNNENLKDFQAVLDSANKTLDAIECVLDRELEIRGEETEVEPKAPKNRYGIGETLYLPVKITGIRESVNGSTVLYEVKTVDGKRLGFKVFECASDIWRDKDHYMATIPEHLLIKNFKEA